MQAITIEKFGAPDVLTVVDLPVPETGANDVLVKVKATAINRADLLQRQGFYPAPSGSCQKIPGLEFSGVVAKVGNNVTAWRQGDRVFGLAGGGTYAEYIVAHERTLSQIPANLSFAQAASLPEAFVTAYDAMVIQAALAAGEKVLITAVGSGVGTAAVQIARAIGALPYGTARTPGKLAAAQALGLEGGIVVADGLYAQAFLNSIAETEKGFDVILELVGGSYVAQDIACAAQKGRIVLVGLMAGTKVEADLGMILRKRLTIKGTTLRARPLEEKMMAAQVLSRNLVPLFASGALKPIIDKVFPLKEACDGHKYMENNNNFGKIILEVC